MQISAAAGKLRGLEIAWISVEGETEGRNVHGKEPSPWRSFKRLPVSLPCSHGGVRVVSGSVNVSVCLSGD